VGEEYTRNRGPSRLLPPLLFLLVGPALPADLRAEQSKEPAGGKERSMAGRSTYDNPFEEGAAAAEVNPFAVILPCPGPARAGDELRPALPSPLL
jgi:hypothetical protein